MIVVLAAVAIAAAASAIFHVLSSTDAARVRSVEMTLAASVEALADAFMAAHPPSLSAADLALLEDKGRTILAPLVDTMAGFCTDDGQIIARATAGRRGVVDRKPKPLPPDQRDALIAACQARGTRDTNYVQISHPHDVIVIAIRRIAADGSAWALTRAPTPPAETEFRWKLDLGVLSAATLLLVAVTVSAVFALGGGVRDLQGGLRKLQHDLRAPLAEPRTSEFAQLTWGLREMAVHLAEAQERERGLLQDLSHRERLSALGRVVAGVAHEIRNPIAGVKLKLDVLDRSKDTAPGVRAEVRSCLEEIGRLDRIVQSFLVVARKSKRQVMAVDLGPLVDERARLLEGSAAARSVEIHRQGDATALGDRDELARSFDNLLRNAVEASPPNQAVLARLSTDGDAAHLSIIDHGDGVPDDRRAELFEPFVTSKADGMGLGLWLSRSLIEADGGSLVYERVAGKTVFRVSLPLAGNT
jgi:signal transduction histidine kinase